MKTEYQKLAKPCEGSFKEKGSRFLAFGYPVGSESEVKTILNHLNKKYHDARHCCYAYIIGNKSEIIKVNDDGEPKHSAGDPILGQIKSFNLTYTLVVVIRYFGGTKLGKSGLINAYKTATFDGLKNSEIIKQLIASLIIINFEYSCTAQIQRLIKDFKVNISEQSFEEECRMILQVPVNKIDNFLLQIKNFKSQGLKIRITKKG